MTSTVKQFNDQKGFGFISNPKGGSDIFVHHSNIKMNGRRTLRAGQTVTFETETTAKGLRAINVYPD
jgi:CspA family cold shock protein